MPNSIESIGASLAAGQFPLWNGSAFVGADVVWASSLVPFPAFQEVHDQQFNLPSGTNTIPLSAPEGYRLILAVWYMNLGGATVNWIMQMTRAGQPVKFFSGATTPTAFPAAAAAGNFAVMEHTDSDLAVVTDQPGLFMSALGWLVPTNHKLQPRAVPLVNGDNVLYTCPAGKVAYLVSGLVRVTQNTFNWVAQDGTMDRIEGYRILPPATPDLTNKIMRHQTNLGVNDGAFGNTTYYVKFAAGEQFLLVVTSAFKGTAYFAIWEEDA